MNTRLNERFAQEPSLYRVAKDEPFLDFEFARCSSCKGLTFPATAPGCQHCGVSLDGAERIARAGCGELLEFVTIHVPLRPDMAAPSIAGDIRIADGVVQEGLLVVDEETQLRHGMAVRAVAVPLPGGDYYACRFVPVVEVPA